MNENVFKALKGMLSEFAILNLVLICKSKIFKISEKRAREKKKRKEPIHEILFEILFIDC